MLLNIILYLNNLFYPNIDVIVYQRNLQLHVKEDLKFLVNLICSIENIYNESLDWHIIRRIGSKNTEI